MFNGCVKLQRISLAIRMFSLLFLVKLGGYACRW